MTAIGLVRSRGLCGRGWSLAALALCLVAVAGSFAAVSSDQRITDWKWWLLGFPVGACLTAVALPVRNVRIGAAIVMASFIVVGSLSIGMFFLPAFVALILAISRRQR